jgi:2-polyprenyl-6-methoxyphenol hydroxylase-like FAD-dependent oxidoreductase
VFDHRLRQIESLADALGPVERRRLSTVANRRTLRQILLAGLGDAVEFGREVVAVRDTGRGVTASFADGGTVGGDVLVAADGINSTVRRQLLPGAELYDTGLRGIYGYAILDWHLRDVLPDRLLVGSPRVIGPDGITMALGAYRPAESPQRAAARLAPYARLSHVPEYVKWTLVGSPDRLGATESWLRSANPEQLHALAGRIVADWHPVLAELVHCADPPATFSLSIRGALPVPPWPTSRITLLGDAIHATTPAGGPGANVALRDAALLAERLTEVDRGLAAPIAAIAAYEAQMREYGFAAAVRSLRSAEQVFGARQPVAA